ncbi:trypsin-like peptidase domain-containing protein [Candidatus Woesearchaeota archaeon]|nr:trypsin-like peptidase domain-containing protein [Candidatus Woesearchaeota archaeon]
MLDKKTRNIGIIFAILVLLSIGGTAAYFNYQLKIARQDYDAKILDLGQQTAANLQALKSTLDSLGINLSSQISLVDLNLQNFKGQNQEQIKTLSDLIDEIERQSSIQLTELKDELKNIKIKSADFSAIVDDVLQSVVSVKTNVGQGSGVIIGREGYIVTNVHVINGASAVKVTTFSGDTYNVNVLAGYDGNADIAVLKIDAPNLIFLNFGDSDDVKVGEKVIAAGNPAGLAFTVTEGIVSAFRTFDNIKYIQTDVPINPGNSGGPLINTKGEIIGINNFKVGGFEGLGFAISSNEVKSISSRIISGYEAKQSQ